MKTDTATAIGGWLAAHMEVFPDLKWPTAETDTLGILPDLRRRLVREGFTDPEMLAEISRHMLASGDRLFTLQDHIKQVFITGHMIRRTRGQPAREQQAPKPNTAEDAFMARCDRISDWFENQSEEVKTRWRSDARPGLPGRAPIHLIDQFVVGVIAHRFPEFDGDADAGRGRVATAEAAPY